MFSEWQYLQSYTVAGCLDEAIKLNTGCGQLTAFTVQILYNHTILGVRNGIHAKCKKFGQF